MVMERHLNSRRFDFPRQGIFIDEIFRMKTDRLDAMLDVFVALFFPEIINGVTAVTEFGRNLLC
jgi:hypothetical protein